MIHEPQTFVITDPRMFDGTGFEVAGRAVAQLRALERLIELSLEGTEAMVRNAEMDRRIEDETIFAAPPWEETPQGRIFARLRNQTRDAIVALNALERAATYDPKHPPT